MTMTTGELGYDAIFRQFPGGADEGQNTTEVPFFPVSVILWIFFLILMPILLTNLLVSSIENGTTGTLRLYLLGCLISYWSAAISVTILDDTKMRRNDSHSILVVCDFSEMQW